MIAVRSTLPPGAATAGAGARLICNGSSSFDFLLLSVRGFFQERTPDYRRIYPFFTCSCLDCGLSRESQQRDREKSERERERRSHFGSSAAPLLGGLFRLLASGEMHGVALGLCPQGSPVAFPSGA